MQAQYTAQRERERERERIWKKSYKDNLFHFKCPRKHFFYIPYCLFTSVCEDVHNKQAQEGRRRGIIKEAKRRFSFFIFETIEIASASATHCRWKKKRKKCKRENIKCNIKREMEEEMWSEVYTYLPGLWVFPAKAVFEIFYVEEFSYEFGCFWFVWMSRWLFI